MSRRSRRCSPALCIRCRLRSTRRTARRTRYLVWTPTGTRSVNADGVPFATVGLCVVTVATQTEGDTLTAEVLQALASAHIAIGQSEQSFDQETMTYYSDIPCEVI